MTVHIRTHSRYNSPSECPDVSTHTKTPAGYLAHLDWMDKKIETHTQHQCPTCGYWVIWVKRGTDV